MRVERLVSRSQAGLSRVTSPFAFVVSDRSTLIYFLILVAIVSMGLFGPALAPYQYDETLYTGNYDVLSSEPPSLAHPLGTTENGYDVLSRILVGARPTVITGLLSGLLIIGIGATIGMTAGYVGGRTDGILMRFTDLVYGVPILPTALILVTFLGVSQLTTIVVIGVILWRGNARVIRSQVLQIKKQPYITAAKAYGASTPRIIRKHILPNVAAMAVLFFAIGVGYAIIIQAGLAFLGVANPFLPSWGVMVRNAYNAGAVTSAWWWSFPPGILISLTVLSTFMIGRRYEDVAGDTDEEILVQAG